MYTREYTSNTSSTTTPIQLYYRGSTTPYTQVVSGGMHTCYTVCTTGYHRCYTIYTVEYLWYVGGNTTTTSYI